MPAYKQASHADRHKYGPDDGLILTCYCGADEQVGIEESISMEREEQGMDYPDLFSFTVTRYIWYGWDRIKEAWKILRGDPWPGRAATDEVLIDEDAARVLRDWLTEKLDKREAKDGR